MSTSKPKRRDTRKGNRIKVCLTEEQFAKIQKMMKQTGLSAQKLLLKASLSRHDLESPVYSPEEGKLFLAALNRIGHRINELAVQANMGTLTDWSKKCAPILSALVRFRAILEGKEPISALGLIYPMHGC